LNALNQVFGPPFAPDSYACLVDTLRSTATTLVCDLPRCKSAGSQILSDCVPGTVAHSSLPDVVVCCLWCVRLGSNVLLFYRSLPLSTPH
jgi:hypothetical protein